MWIWSTAGTTLTLFCHVWLARFPLWIWFVVKEQDIPRSFDIFGNHQDRINHNRYTRGNHFIDISSMHSECSFWYIVLMEQDATSACIVKPLARLTLGSTQPKSYYWGYYPLSGCAWMRGTHFRRLNSNKDYKIDAERKRAAKSIPWQEPKR